MRMRCGVTRLEMSDYESAEGLHVQTHFNANEMWCWTGAYTLNYIQRRMRCGVACLEMSDCESARGLHVNLHPNANEMWCCTSREVRL